MAVGNDLLGDEIAVAVDRKTPAVVHSEKPPREGRAGLLQGEVIGLGKGREVKSGTEQPVGPGTGRKHGIQLVAQQLQGVAGNPFSQPPQGHVDRVDQPAAGRFLDQVADPLDGEPAPQKIGRLPGQLGHPGKLKEVGKQQAEKVQGVALDLAAVQYELAGKTGDPGDLHPEGVLQSEQRRHLVHRGAERADPADDVGDLGEAATHQERLEEAGGFGQAELDPLHPGAVQVDLQAAVPLHAREGIYFNDAAHSPTPG